MFFAKFSPYALFSTYGNITGRALRNLVSLIALACFGIYILDIALLADFQWNIHENFLYFE